MDNNKFNSFKEFYPFYLSEHSKKETKITHVIGSGCVLILLTYSIITKDWFKLAYMPLFGYGFAWIGHFFFEKNRPATFTYPKFSFMGDWVMFKDIIIGRESIVSPKISNDV